MRTDSLVGKVAPEFSMVHEWINSRPLAIGSLKGKVVFLEFWTFDCYNCHQDVPRMKHLHSEFAGDKFVLIGVHTPEFDFERPPENVAEAVKRLGIEYPVALDGTNATWKLYGNRYWPRQALIDSTGELLWEHVGEVDSDKISDRISSLLKTMG